MPAYAQGPGPLRRRIALAALVSAGLSLAACKDNRIGSNQACTSNCFSLSGIAQDQVEAAAKHECEAMGHKGIPEIAERSETSVVGRCTD